MSAPRRAAIAAAFGCLVLLAAAAGAAGLDFALPDGVAAVDVPRLDANAHGTAAEVYDAGVAGAVVGLRRAIHEKPGIMYDEYEASRIVTETLLAMGIPASNIETGIALTGVIAHLGAGTLASSKAGEGGVPTIALRADMDALPIHEETDVPFKSTVPGVMHACGHDTHTAMLLGAAKLLKPFEERLKAEGKAVRFAFQPGEEGGAGGKRMIDEGLLEGAHAAFALHTKSTSPTGLIIGKEGGCRRAPPVPDTARIVGRDARRD